MNLKNRTRKHFIFTAAFLLFCSSILTAETITFSADNMAGQTGDDSDYTKMEGNAHVTTDSMEILADLIELKGEDFRYIIATGNIKGSNTKSKLDFTCEKLTYDRETEIATLENSVHLIDTENEVTADAQYIEYNQNTEIAVMQISVNLTQKDNVCTAAYAIYRKKDQMLEMNGNPKVVQGKDTFRAQTITLNLDTQEIALDGRVKGSVTTNEKSKENEEKQEDQEIQNSEQQEAPIPTTEIETEPQQEVIPPPPKLQSETDNFIPPEKENTNETTN